MSKTVLSTRADIMDKALVRGFAYINGKWSASASGDTISVSDPATGDLIGEVANLSAAESSLAVDAAQAAFQNWSGLLPQDRATIMRRWFDLIQEHKQDLARIMVLEQGKPLSEFLTDIIVITEHDSLVYSGVFHSICGG